MHFENIKFSKTDGGAIKFTNRYTLHQIHEMFHGHEGFEHKSAGIPLINPSELHFFFSV